MALYSVSTTIASTLSTEKSGDLLTVRTTYSDEDRDGVSAWYLGNGWQLLHHDEARRVFMFYKRHTGQHRTRVIGSSRP